jgi:mRNA interferase RelE/StbE
MTYVVSLTSHAERQYDKLPVIVQEQLDAAFLKLELDPRPAGVKKLRATKAATWRIRIGDYRALFTINDAQHEVDVIDIDLRDKVYKQKS